MFQAAAALDQLVYWDAQAKFLSPEDKEKCIAHVINLQQTQDTSIWEYRWNYCNTPKGLVDLVNFGLDPNWINRKTLRSLLFTPMAINFVPEITCITTLKDRRGDNALEHHCRNNQPLKTVGLFFQAVLGYSRAPEMYAQADALLIIKQLTTSGLSIQSTFPYYDDAVRLFPDDTFLQAVLVFCLYDQTQARYAEALHFLTSIQQITPFQTTIMADNALRDKINARPNFNPNGNKLDSTLLATKTGCDVSLCQTIIISILPYFWGELDESLFKIIPESNNASLMVAILDLMFKQNTANKIPVDILFIPLKNQEDLLAFNHYLIAHPALMKTLVNNLMFLDRVDYCMGGKMEASYHKVVLALLNKLDGINHVASDASISEKLAQAYDDLPAPIPIRTLEIPANAKIFQLGRTFIIETLSGGKDAFKIMKKDEKYNHFAREMSITNALLHDISGLGSRFHRPIGIYEVSYFPVQFTQDAALFGEGPFIIYHYQASAHTFTYLQNIDESEFEQSRVACLKDEAMLTRNGVLHDGAAIYHDYYQNSRPYDLLHGINIKLTGGILNASVGKMDCPLEKSQFPNWRRSGLTDMGDIKRIKHPKGISYGTKKIFHVTPMKDTPSTHAYLQMYGLSRILLVDLLLLVHRYKDRHELYWKDESITSKMGNELMNGFAAIIEGYAEIRADVALTFAKECGIDWQLLAKQTAFWFDPSSQGYIPWVIEGQIPKGLYPEAVRFNMDVIDSPNFDMDKGYLVKGRHNIGPFSGPTGLDELEKLAHLLFVPVMEAEFNLHENRLAFAP